MIRLLKKNYRLQFVEFCPHCRAVFTFEYEDCKIYEADYTNDFCEKTVNCPQCGEKKFTKLDSAYLPFKEEEEENIKNFLFRFNCADRFKSGEGK